jgi:hypothetical protein
MVGKPNVLLIMADDVGWFDVGAYNRGIMGRADPEHRPHRGGRGAVHRRLRAGESHGGTSGVHHRADPAAHGLDHGGHARRSRPLPPDIEACILAFVALRTRTT